QASGANRRGRAGAPAKDRCSPRPLLKPHGRRILCERGDERVCAVAPRTRLGGSVCRAKPVRTAVERRPMARTAGTSVRAEVRWCDALIATERLRELGGLAVADAMG